MKDRLSRLAGAAVLLVIAVGCQSTVPLAAIPGSKRDGLALVAHAKQAPTLDFSTARGRNARQHSGNSGLIGVMVALSIGSGDEAAGRTQLKQIHQGDPVFELGLVLGKIRAQLHRAGIVADGAESGRILSIEIRSISLEETQRGFCSPSFSVSARLTDAGGNSIWSATARSTGHRMRTLAEYARQPESYREDFAEVAEDVAQQLVSGPLRR